MAHQVHTSVFGQFDSYFRYSFDHLSRDVPTIFPCQGQQATEVKVMVTPEEATYHGWGTYQHPFGWLVLRFRRIFLGWEVKQFIGSQWKFDCQSCGFGWSLANERKNVIRTGNGNKSLIHPLGEIPLVRLGSHPSWLSLIHWIIREWFGSMFKICAKFMCFL